MDRLSNLGLSHNAPPSSSSTFLGGTGQSLAARLKPNLGGLNAYQRERDLSARYGAYNGAVVPPGKTEWEILQDHHRFIRDDEEPGDVSWEERLARAYESKLFKEFALIDLKHYKSHQFALRWRTAPEVVEGVGEDTCAGLRCKYHRLPSTSSSSIGDTPREEAGGWSSDEDDPRGGERERRKERKRKKRRTMPVLKAFELPFRYSEAGESKEALVKVKLCPKCVRKLLYKPKQEASVSGSDEDEQAEKGRGGDTSRGKDASNGKNRRGRNEEDSPERDRRPTDGHGERRKERRRDRSRDRSHLDTPRDRSRSPRRRNEI